MRVTRFMVVVAAVVALTTVYAQAQTVLVKAVVTGTSYEVIGGKIVKIALNTKLIISQCPTAGAGAQLVAVFNTNTLEVVGLDVVDKCGATLCELATFSQPTNCVDTGVASSKEEIICFVPFSFTGGSGDGTVISDLKLTFDSTGGVKSGSLKGTGVFETSAGGPGVINVSASSLFKPASGCP